MEAHYDLPGRSLFSRSALVAGNQGLTFLGGVANSGEQIARVRITAGQNTLVSNGVLGNLVDDFVVMDDFIYATPTAVPEPATTSLFGLGLVALGWAHRAFRRSK